MKRAILGTLWLAAFVLVGPARAQEAPRVDVVFLLDATGSMGDEIDAVKERIRGMIADIAVGAPAPDVRFGIVAYRDRGDDYVTVVYDLSRDIDAVVGSLDRVEAGGGGDYAESLNEGLHVALHGLSWEEGDGVSRLVFLIADAPPHLDYADDFDYREEYQMAAERGIAVHALGASGLDEEGEAIFREIAEGTGGRFQWLTYESRYVDQDGEEVIVVVEGRTATYTRGDSTWTVEGGAPMLGGSRGSYGVDAATEDCGCAVTPTPTSDAPAPSGEVSTSLNLAELITDAVKAAVAERSEGDGSSTAVETATWGRIKAQVR